MAVHGNNFSRISPTDRAARPRIEPILPRKPDSERALAYGFSAIGAFMFGGVGYLNGILSTAGFGVSVLVAFVAFVLSYWHLEAA